MPDKKMKEVTQVLHSFLEGCTIVWSSHMRPLCFYGVQRPNEEDIDANVEVPLEVVQDAVVLCVSAIGCPESLALVLKQVGSPNQKCVLQGLFLLWQILSILTEFARICSIFNP